MVPKMVGSIRMSNSKDKWGWKICQKTTMENFADLKDNLQISFWFLFFLRFLNWRNRLLLFICLTLRDMGCVCVGHKEIERKIVDIFYPIFRFDFLFHFLTLSPPPSTLSIRSAFFNSLKQENLIIFPSHELMLLLLLFLFFNREWERENLFLLLRTFLGRPPANNDEQSSYTNNNPQNPIILKWSSIFSSCRL